MSDIILLFISKDVAFHTKIQHAKGSLFIIITAILLFYLVRHFFEKFEVYEKQLLKDRDYVRLLFNNIPVGVALTDLNGIIQDANRYFLRVLNKNQIEAKGTNLLETLKHIDKNHGRLDNILKNSNYIYEEPIMFEITKDTSVFQIQMEKTSIAENDYLFFTLVDVTSLKQKEKEIIESQKKFREIVDNAYIIILILSLDGKILFINSYGEIFFGYDSHEIIGKSALGTIIPEIESTGRDLKTFFSDLLDNPLKFTCNINENINKYGNRYWIFWVNRLITDNEGRPKEILSIGMDITELKTLQDELEKYKNNLERLVYERTKQLEEANEKLKDLDRLKSMFIASMSHELRTPLNSIIGFSSILLNEWVGPLNDEQKKNIEIINKAGKHLLTLVNDIIDISKIESGLIDIKFEEINLETLIEECISILIHDINKKGLNLTKEIQQVNLISDKKRLKQVIFNLLNNAIKFTERGYIKISTLTQNDNIIIEIEDSGIGIKEEDLNKLFKPFQRVSPQKLAYVPGTGLGLYISKKIVEDLLKGSISVKSQYGKGSKFIVTIPKEITHEKSPGN